ncbi:hypothetical protein [Pelagibius sp. Alg239-R121]|uniref:hypothetical protein n=1 Tax=Pelagibius sp. Alg239-R121 TaxID=2993448 RepID=UPI0024A67F8D|nr:hypothetical protein [Pelagibius sp. Alg239-R121]
MANTAVKRGGDQGTELPNRYEVYPDQPLPFLNSPGVDAVAAHDTRNPSRNLFAIICKRELAPRVDAIRSLSHVESSAFLTPRASGVITLSRDQSRKFAIVFEQPRGDRVQMEPDAAFQPIAEDDIIRGVILPMMSILREIGSRVMAHRAIRADNVFISAGSNQEMILGECVSTPAGYFQPVIYEPIDAAMSNPSGRGAGYVSDDYYALGVLIAVLNCGGNPIAHMSDDEVVASKIAVGSYATLVGPSKVSLKLMEALRGLLCDDPHERWSISDLELWANGRHLSPKQATLPPKAARTFEFEGEEYITAPGLSFAMGQNWAQAQDKLRDDALEGWVRRSLSDDKRASSILKASRMSRLAGESGGGGQDKSLSGVLVALDHTAPIRYKTVSARLDGLAQALAIDFGKEHLPEMICEVVRAKLHKSWIESQPAMRPDFVPWIRQADMIETFVNRSMIGYGPERALYECNSGWPCLSPLLKDQFVNEIPDLLPALERVAESGVGDREPIDRHIAAFCAARSKNLSERLLNKLADPKDKLSYYIAVLRLYAEVQRAVGPASLPNISRWFAQLLTPIVETYHFRSFREQLSKGIDGAVKGGDLAGLLWLVDNEDLRRQDDTGFEQAQREFAYIAGQITWHEEGGLTSKARVAAVSQRASAVVSSVLASVSIAVMSLIYVS